MMGMAGRFAVDVVIYDRRLRMAEEPEWLRQALAKDERSPAEGAHRPSPVAERQTHSDSVTSPFTLFSSRLAIMSFAPAALNAEFIFAIGFAVSRSRDLLRVILRLHVSDEARDQLGRRVVKHLEQSAFELDEEGQVPRTAEPWAVAYCAGAHQHHRDVHALT
jgi:hypothetical protein